MAAIRNNLVGFVRRKQLSFLSLNSSGVAVSSFHQISFLCYQGSDANTDLKSGRNVDVHACCLLQKKLVKRLSYLYSNTSQRCLSTKPKLDYKGYFIAKFSEEIDLEALQQKKIKELKESGTNFHVYDVVKTIIAEKCDEAILNLDSDDQKKLKVIQLEHDFLFSEGYEIPSTDEMTSQHWLEALNTSSKQKRLKYYIAMQKKLFKKQNAKQKKEDKVKLSPVESSTIKTEINDNKIMLRVYESTMKRWLNHRLCTSMQFGLPLVIDMEYSEFMSNKHITNTAQQICTLYTKSRQDSAMPFHLHFTGCPTNNPIYRMMMLYMQDDPHFMATVSPQSYLEHFDKDKLVYLSPHAKHVMREFDPEAVYIIGAFNDQGNQDPVSYARAKKQGIQCVRLPLDNYLQWNIGSKALTLNQVMSIMVGVKNGESWPKALEVVPTRKHLGRRKK